MNANARNSHAGRNRLLVLVFLILAGTGTWYMFQGKEKVETKEPLLVSVRVGSIENTISAAGSLKPSNYVDVGAQVSGLLQKLHVDVGDEVEEGQLLAEIDARLQEERVKSSKASLEGQKAQLESRVSSLTLAQTNADRQVRLFAQNASSQQELDSALDRLASAEAALTQLQKGIEQSEASLQTEVTQLEFTKIYAPVTGTVVSIEMNEGRTLNANQQAPTILRIADLNTMTVETEVSEADIGKVKKGMDVYFTTLGNGTRRWYGSLRQILPTPTVTNNVVLYTGLFDIENNDGALLPEMTTQVYFVSSSAQNVLVAPMGALTFIEENNNVEDSSVMGSGMAAAAGGQRPEITPEMREQFAQMRASGNFPAGAAGRGGQSTAGRGASQPQPGQRSIAKVTVVKDNGTREEREVVIGLTSRVNAEVISGLKAGDQVIAGVLEAAAVSQQESGNNNFRPPFMRF